MSKLNNTEIKKIVHVHMTNKTVLSLTACLLWTALTSFVTYLVVYGDVHKRYQCEPAELMKPVFHEDTKQQKLVTKVREMFKITNDKAQAVVDLAQMHTTPNAFPSATLMLALMAVESSFKENAKSRAGAKGYAQIMPSNSSGKDSVSNLYDAVRLLREYKELTGSIDGALHAYNVGIGNYLQKKMRVPEYVEKIKNTQRQLTGSEMRV